MKKLQSVLAGLLSVCLLTCSASAMSFPDVDSNSPYATAIENISELGIMVGGSNGNFNPDQIVSRCEMATIVCRMLGTTENLSKSEVFDDVPVNHWANAYIARASQLGIVAGYGNGKFGPGDPVTYEQAVTMVVRGIGESENANRYGGYPNGFIQVAEERFLLEGIPVGQGQGMTRGAVAMLLNNYYMWCPSKPGDGHTHHYVERTMPGSGTGGHYEQVQTGTKKVEEWGQVTTWGCGRCSFTTKVMDEIYNHTSGEAWNIGAPCFGANIWSQTKTEVIGTHEEPIYGNKWVDSSEITIRVCALCGQMEQ